jgi:hypothetical protein
VLKEIFDFYPVDWSGNQQTNLTQRLQKKVEYYSGKDIIESLHLSERKKGEHVRTLEK